MTQRVNSTEMDKIIDEIAKNKDKNKFMNTFDSFEHNLNNQIFFNTNVDHLKRLYRLFLIGAITFDKVEQTLIMSRFITMSYKLSLVNSDEAKLSAMDLFVSMYRGVKMGILAVDTILERTKDVERLSAICPQYKHNIYYYIARSYFLKKDWVSTIKFGRLHLDKYYQYTKNTHAEAEKGIINIYAVLFIASLNSSLESRPSAYLYLDTLIKSMNNDDSQAKLIENIRMIFAHPNEKITTFIDITSTKLLLKLFTEITNENNKNCLKQIINRAVISIPDDTEFKLCFNLINEGFGNVSALGTISFFGRTGDKYATLDYVEKIIGDDEMKVLIIHLVNNNYDPIYKHIKLDKTNVHLRDTIFVIAMIHQNKDSTQDAFLHTLANKVGLDSRVQDFDIVISDLKRFTNDIIKFILLCKFMASKMSSIPIQSKLTHFPWIIQRLEMMECEAELVKTFKDALPAITIDIMTPHQLYQYQLSEGIKLIASDKTEDIQNAIQFFTKAMSYPGAEYLKVADLMRNAAMKLDELRITAIVTPFVPPPVLPSCSSSLLSDFSSSSYSPIPVLTLCDDSDTDNESIVITLPPRQKRSKSSSSSSDKHSKKHSKKRHHTK